MAQISPILQFLLSRPQQFKGPQNQPVFGLTAPFDQGSTHEKSKQDELKGFVESGQYPEWLALYLGGGDAQRGHAIMQEAATPSQ